MYTLPSPDYLHMSYRADLDLLVGRWMYPPSHTELQQGYTLLLNVAATHRCVRWLIDVRRRDQTNQSAISWMLETFYPQLPTRLGNRVYLAFLLAPLHLQSIEKDTTLVPLSYFDDLPYQLGRFTEEQAAIAWLNAQCAPQSAPDVH